ncbi:MAG: outer membrane protein [Pseudomonadota bacterium]|jgi:opacity protein-like surface antigen|nr:hypothetical protein [Alphaproteobacteria bacterium]
MKIAFFILGISTVYGFNSNHNFYAGFSLNQCALAGKRNDAATDTTPFNQILVNNKTVQNNGIYAGIIAGYLFKFKDFGIGPEFFYNYGRIENKINSTYLDPAGPHDTKFQVSYKIANQKGLHLRIGYFLDSYFLYTLFGIHSQAGYFEAKGTKSDLGLAPQVIEGTYKSKTKSMTCFNFGLGAQKAIAEHYAIGLECRFSHFPNKNFTFALSDAERTTLNSSFKYQLRSISLKLMYVF